MRHFIGSRRLVVFLLSRFLIVTGHRGLFHSRSFIKFRLRPAVSRVVVFVSFSLGSSFSLFNLLRNGWLTREALTRGINCLIGRRRDAIVYLESKFDDLEPARIVPRFNPGLFDNIQAIIAVPVRGCQGDVNNPDRNEAADPLSGAYLLGSLYPRITRTGSRVSAEI